MINYTNKKIVKMNALTNSFPAVWIIGLGGGANSFLIDAHVSVRLMRLWRVGLGGRKARVIFLNDQLH